MARRDIGQERMITYENFKIRFPLDFSISCSPSLIDKFEFVLRNENADKNQLFSNFIEDYLKLRSVRELKKQLENVDKSKLFLNFIYNHLNVSNDQELKQKLREQPGVREAEDTIKKAFHNLLKINKGEFSKFIRDKFMIPYTTNTID